MKFYLRSIKMFFIRIYEMFFIKKKLSIDKKNDKVFIMLSANYNNMGDIAITLCQLEFLKEIFGSNYDIVEIPVEDTYKCYFSMKKNITSNSIITLIGGGNDGSLYDFIEEPRLFILRKFNKYKIVSFPQSVLFEQSIAGKHYLKKYKKLVSKCSDYNIFARENKSFERYKSYSVNTKIFLAPDIVFYYDRSKCYNRKGVAFIMRNDKEKCINMDFENSILNYLEKEKINVERQDTCDISVKNNTRNITLNEYCEALAKKKLVITDRLHGMILSYVTNTPCIVFNNNNDKIKSTFDTWFYNQNFIYLVDNGNINKVKKLIKELYNIDNIVKDDMVKKYDNLRKILRGDEIK